MKVALGGVVAALAAGAVFRRRLVGVLTRTTGTWVGTPPPLPAPAAPTPGADP